MADHFDVVAVQVQNESRVIVGMVVWPQSGSAVVPAAGTQHRLVERLDLSRSIGPKSDVDPRHVRLALAEGEIRFPSLPETGHGTVKFE